MRTMTPRSSNTLKKTIQFHIFIHLRHTFRLYCIEIIWKYKGKSPERNIVKNKNVVFVLELFQHIQSGFRGFWCEIYWIQTWFVLISFNFCKEFNRSLVMLLLKIRVRYTIMYCAHRLHHDAIMIKLCFYYHQLFFYVERVCIQTFTSWNSQNHQFFAFYFFQWLWRRITVALFIFK